MAHDSAEIVNGAAQQVLSPAVLTALIEAESRKLDPALAKALYALGYAHLQAGRHAQAHMHFHALLGHAPRERSYLAGMALALAGLGQHAAAFELNTVALFWHPRDVAAMLRQAECLLALQRPAEAAVWLDTVIAAAASSAAAADTERQVLAERAAGLRMLLATVLEKTSC